MMRVAPSGDVEVFIPYWLKPEHHKVQQFIDRGLSELGTQLPLVRPEPLHSDRFIRQLVRQWARRMSLKPGRIQIRPMLRKWGSCSSKGSITLNSALYYLPLHLVEYVVVHELVHLLVFDHSPRFWETLALHLPNCRELERELDHYHV